MPDENRLTDGVNGRGDPDTDRGAGFVMLQWTADDRIAAQGDATLLEGLPADEAALLAAVEQPAREALIEAVRHARATGAPFRIECRSVHGRWLDLRGGVVDDEQGRRLIGAIFDSHAARTALQRETLRADRLQREADAARSDSDLFAYAVSHDLRAPLRAIGGFSEVLLESEPGQLEDSARQYLPRIVSATKRMAQLLDDLLQLSRFNRADLHAEGIDLAALARDAVARVQDARPGRAIELTLPTATVPALGDRALLAAVLERLFDNAWKATAQREAPRIEVGCQADATQTRCYVRDNGIGFDPAQAERLFQPLQRLHRASDFEGAGVGLTIVRRIIERHGGRVWAEGKPGHGACFWFSLPNAPAGAGD
jgi:signal transduction histidine kinase